MKLFVVSIILYCIGMVYVFVVTRKAVAQARFIVNVVFTQRFEAVRG